RPSRLRLNFADMQDRDGGALVMHQEALRIDEDMALLALDLLARIIARRIDAGPFFRALDALAVDDRGGRACFAPRSLAAFAVKGVMDAVERAVPAPKVEIVVDRRARRQILRDRA